MMNDTNTWNRRWARWVLASVCVMGACTSDEPEVDIDVPQIVTWHQDIAPIVAGHCRSCHTDGGVAYFSMDSYQQALPFASTMASQAESREMPPWGPADTEECEHRFGWNNDRSLTDEQIALLRAWVDDGAPEGDPVHAAPLPPVPDFALSDASHNLTPEFAYTTGGAFDELICFVVDPQLTEDRWATAVQFTPGNPEVVHHTGAVIVPPQATDELLALAGPDGAYPCFGGFGLSAGSPLGGWVPGMMPFELPEGTGVHMPAGSLIAMQIHYHPVSEQAAPDLTTIHIRTTTDEPPRRLNYIGYGNRPSPPFLQPGPNDRGQVEFRIPANVPDHVETWQQRFEDGLSVSAVDRTRRYTVFGAFPHMHYIGVDIQGHIARAVPPQGQPAQECMIQVPAWNFDWQSRYFYDTDPASMPTIGPGDTVTLRCSYDNTMANPFVRRALSEQGLSAPRDVYMGDGTLDEMCWLGFYLID